MQTISDYSIIEDGEFAVLRQAPAGTRRMGDGPMRGAFPGAAGYRDFELPEGTQTQQRAQLMFRINLNDAGGLVIAVHINGKRVYAGGFNGDNQFARHAVVLRDTLLTRPRTNRISVQRDGGAGSAEISCVIKHYQRSVA
jgi:hypothetical protein